MKSKDKFRLFVRDNIKILIVLGMFAVAFIITSFVVNFQIRKQKAEYNKLINWEELKVDEVELNKEVTPIQGTISLEEYIKLREKDSLDGLLKIDGILPTNIVNNIREGIDSQYYLDSVTADYAGLCESIRELIKQCEYINKLYTAYQTDIGIEDIDYCVEYGEGSKDKCDLYDYFVMYSTGDLKQYFIDTHSKWESIVNYTANKENLEDSYIDLYYQNEICTNLKYLNKVNVEVVVVNKDMYDSGIEALQKAKDDGMLLVDNYNETKVDYLTQLNLYRDINFYDGEMVKLADKTISSLFTTEVVDEGSLKQLGTDLTEEELKQQLESIKATTSEATISNADEQLELENYQVLEYSLTGRDERDVYYILYKVKEAEHNIDMIPSKEDMMYTLTLQAKAMMAQQRVSQIILAEVNDIDVSGLENSDEDTHNHGNELGEILN